MNKDINEELEDIDYSYSHLLKPKWIISVVVLILFILISSIPFSQKLESTIRSAIRSSGCPIQYSDYQVSFFMPKVHLNNLSIPRSCTGLAKDLKLPTLALKFRGPSFSPFGLAFKVETKFENSPLDVKLVTGFSEMSAHLTRDSNNKIDKNNLINLSDFNDIQRVVKLSGSLHLSNVYLRASYAGSISELKLNIASNNFKVPGQRIHILKIDTLDIGHLLLQAEIDPKKVLQIKQLTIGKEGSPIIANFKGQSKLNNKNIRKSTLKIRGELGLSTQFIEKYALVNMFLQKFDKKDNFYQIEISGRLESPQFSSAR